MIFRLHDFNPYVTINKFTLPDPFYSEVYGLNKQIYFRVAIGWALFFGNLCEILISRPQGACGLMITDPHHWQISKFFYSAHLTDNNNNNTHVHFLLPRTCYVILRVYIYISLGTK